jgi:VCBS repeat-containing protein
MTRESTPSAEFESLEPRLLMSGDIAGPLARVAALAKANPACVKAVVQQAVKTIASGVAKAGRDRVGDTIDDASVAAFRRRDVAYGKDAINSADDVDVFALTATKSGRVDLLLWTPCRKWGLVGDLAVLDADGNVLASATESGGRDVAVDFLVTEGQTFYVAVAGAGSSTGVYQWRARLTESANQPPVAADDAAAMDEDGSYVSAPGGVLGNDSDPEGDSLVARLVSGPAHGTLALAADGSFTYTPDANWFGTDAFTYAASDGTAEAAATVTLTVNPVNDAPVAAADDLATDEDVPLVLDLTANDADADGDSLAAQIVDGPSHGTISQNESGALVYTPDADWYGTDTFTYRASDGELASEVVAVTVVVAPVNDAPAAADDAYSMAAGGVLNVMMPGILANDTDVEGDWLTALVTSDPSHGSLLRDPLGGFVYTPLAGFSGTDSFTYMAADGSAFSNVATVTITVA